MSNVERAGFDQIMRIIEQMDTDVALGAFISTNDKSHDSLPDNFSLYERFVCR